MLRTVNIYEIKGRTQKNETKMSFSTTGIVGKGVLGTALYVYLKENGIEVKAYDKYVPSTDCLSMNDLKKLCQILFLCLPTPVQDGEYILGEMNEVLEQCETFTGGILIRSTVLPGTIDLLQKQFPKLHLFHFPEFLSSQTATFDMKYSSKPLYLGCSSSVPVSMRNHVLAYLELAFPGRKVWTLMSNESESIKLFTNVFYAKKLALFQQFYSICEKAGIDFNIVRQGMLQQEWIHPSHTYVPGSDGLTETGGACLPKDVLAFDDYFFKICFNKN